MFTTDLDATTQPDDAQVKVLHDRATGNTVVALKAAAASALMALLNSIDLHDMSQNPGGHGLDADDARRQTAVGFEILGQMGKLAGVAF